MSPNRQSKLLNYPYSHTTECIVTVQVIEVEGELHHHYRHLHWVGVPAVDRGVALRKAISHANRLPCSRSIGHTCTDAATDATMPCQRLSWRRSRSAYSTSSAYDETHCASLPSCGDKLSRTPNIQKELEHV